MNRPIRVQRMSFDSVSQSWTLVIQIDPSWSSTPRPIASDLPTDVAEALWKWLAPPASRACPGNCSTMATPTIGAVGHGWQAIWCPRRSGWHIEPAVT